MPHCLFIKTEISGISTEYNGGRNQTARLQLTQENPREVCVTDKLYHSHESIKTERGADCEVEQAGTVGRAVARSCAVWLEESFPTQTHGSTNRTLSHIAASVFLHRCHKGPVPWQRKRKKTWLNSAMSGHQLVSRIPEQLHGSASSSYLQFIWCLWICAKLSWDILGPPRVSAIYLFICSFLMLRGFISPRFKSSL